MAENNGERGEMLPIPPDLLAESQKKIGIVMDTGFTIDLTHQGNTLIWLKKQLQKNPI